MAVSPPPSERAVLLAEDDPDAAHFVVRVLRKVSPAWTVHWVENGVSAVDYVMDHGLPQVVMTDLQMPHMDGYELIAWIRAQDPCRHRPRIFVLSGSLDAERVKRCRELGVDEFIPKQSCLHELELHLHRIF